MTCPPEDSIRGFLDGTLPEEQLEGLEAHVDTCASCGPRLLELAREHHRLAGEAPAGGLLARGSTVGRFVVLEVLGRGAFGTVYAAYDPRLDRRLALKVLDAWSVGERERDALVHREARVLARVSHPNVVTVHDAGLAGGVPFVAMEFVAGTTLTRWLEAPRAPAEVLAAFCEAGRGLGAVHAAGLVHGDFRSDNVLVGTDGRLRVSDFGLAAIVADAGATQGSPALEVPERQRGVLPTALADQYAFALCLKRALASAVTGRGGLSRRVRAALARALAVDPTERFASMEALVDALAPPSASPRLVAAVAALALLLGAAGWWWQAATRCDPDPAALAGVWDDASRADLATAFARLERPHATEASRLVLAAFDRWRAEWLDASRAACTAAHVARPEGAADGERRGACLAEARREVAAMVGALRGADADLVSRAHQAVLALESPARCADAVALADEPAPRDLPRRRQFRALREALAEARGLRALGKHREARAQLEPLLAQARAAGFSSVVAATAFELGATLGRLQDDAAAVALLEEAATTGLLAHAEEVAAHAAVLLVFEKGVRQRQPEAAAEVARFAAVLAQRLGDRRLEAGLVVNRALVAEAQGRVDEAIALQSEAVERFEAVAPGTPALANALLNLSRLLVTVRREAEGRRAAERALELFEQTRGPAHPNVGVAATVLGSLAFEAGDLEAAEALFSRALGIARAALGETHVEVVGATDALARVALARGEFPRALALAEAAVALRRGDAGVAEGGIPEPLLTLAEAQLAAGQWEAARATMAHLPERPGADVDDAVRRQLLLARAPWLPLPERARALKEAEALAPGGSALARRVAATRRTLVHTAW